MAIVFALAGWEKWQASVISCSFLAFSILFLLGRRFWDHFLTNVTSGLWQFKPIYLFLDVGKFVTYKVAQCVVCAAGACSPFIHNEMPNCRGDKLTKMIHCLLLYCKTALAYTISGGGSQTRSYGFAFLSTYIALAAHT